MSDLRVGLLGGGNINRTLRREIERSRPYGIVGTYGRDDALPVDGVEVVVEAATQQAVRERIPALLDAGIDVILLSIGALADAELRARLTSASGRLIACTGAIGGLDQVRALRAAGPLHEVSIESRKRPGSLVQPWMDAELKEALCAGDREVVLADGPAGDVAQQFPSSANVAAALALASDSWAIATARIVADPTAVRTRHVIRASGEIGEVQVAIENAPSPERPRSSSIVSWAALRALDDYARLRGFAAPEGVAFL